MSLPFHMAFPVNDLETTKNFYSNTLGCKIGRFTDKWVDFDFFGNQISAHLCDADLTDDVKADVDDVAVPIRHFGAILEWNQWENLKTTLEASNTEFIIEPQVRFQGEAGEQATMFFKDPSGNCLEFKAYKYSEQIFAS